MSPHLLNELLPLTEEGVQILTVTCHFGVLLINILTKHRHDNNNWTRISRTDRPRSEDRYDTFSLPSNEKLMNPVLSHSPPPPYLLFGLSRNEQLPRFIDRFGNLNNYTN